MTVRKFEGQVHVGDPYRVSGHLDGLDGAIWIGHDDLVFELDNTNFDGNVIVGIGDESFDGDLFVETGWGYSEYTPVDPDQLKVGGSNILNILRGYEGEYITVWVSDEPINLLDEENKG